MLQFSKAGLALNEEKQKDGFARFGSKLPSKQMVNALIRGLDGSTGKTLGEIYSNTHNGYSWKDFIAAVDYMVAEGILEGKGDGFVVNYSLTPKAQHAGRSRSST